MDSQELSAELYRRTRKKIDPNDPAFMLVVLNEILLEQSANDIGERTAIIADGFEHTTRRGTDELIEAINKASAVIQGQVTTLEAAALKISVPELVAQKHPEAELEKPTPQIEQGSMPGMLASVWFYAAGVLTGFFLAGLGWIFIRW
ncbi:MAG: hypothetical protein PHF20_01440 [Halothiobacillaceae bacterium]|nr:hypothetical protein [Halothiobacillaceae bacterium]